MSLEPILAWKSARDIAATEPDRHDYLQDNADNARCNELNSIDKLHLSERAKHATHIALMLDDPSAHVRLCAMEMLYTLKRTALIPHAHTILQRLTDSSVYVRLATLVTFRKIDDLANIFASTVVDMLAEPCTDVVCEAFLTLTNFIGATPAIDESIIANILTNASAPPTVLIRAMEYVVELDSTSIEHHARAIADSLHHADSDVRYAALDALSQLEEHALVPHATAIASLLDDADPDVVRAASNALGQLQPEERTRAQQRAKDIKIKARAQPLGDGTRLHQEALPRPLLARTHWQKTVRTEWQVGKARHGRIRARICLTQLYHNTSWVQFRVHIHLQLYWTL